MHAANLCRQTITLNSFLEESQIYLGSQVENTKTCVGFWLGSSSTFHFPVGKYHRVWSDLPARFSTSYTSHNFHLKQRIHFAALMNPWCYFTRTSPSLPTLEWERTSMSRNFIAFSIISHRLLFLAQLITTTPNNRSASTSTLPRMLTMQRITKMSILKWLGGWSAERRCSNTLPLFEGSCRLHIIATRLECL